MKVSVGPATIFGYVLSLFAAGGTVLAAVEHELAGPGKWLALISAVTAIMTNLGRQLQAISQAATIPSGIAVLREGEPNEGPPFGSLPPLGSVVQQQASTGGSKVGQIT